MSAIHAGAAWEDITPLMPVDIAGQLHVRKGMRTRDPITVNAAAFRQDSRTILLISVDVCVLDDAFVTQMRERCGSAWKVAPDDVFIGATHTHVAPCTVTTLVGEMNHEFMEGMTGGILRACGRAIADLEEVELYATRGYCEEMGWNRRGLHSGGRCDMYYGSWNKDFAGIEGPRDGSVPVIFAKRSGRPVKLVVTGFTTHPNCVEGESYYSADMVGATRKYLRGILGPQLNVVYFTGAAGDTAPSIMADNPHNNQPWRGEEGVERSGAYLASEIAKCLLSTVKPMVNPVIRVAGEVLEIPLRPWPTSFDPQKLTWEGARVYFGYQKANWDRYMQEMSPAMVRANAIRLGDAVICTNPAELYCAVGLRIKEKCPAKMTMIAQLTDGYCGYVPTEDAFARGGYSTWNALSCKLAAYADSLLVEASTRLIARVMA